MPPCRGKPPATGIRHLSVALKSSVSGSAMTIVNPAISSSRSKPPSRSALARRKQMARPISLELPPHDAREEVRDRVEQAPGEHVEALLESYQLVAQLHRHSGFELLRGALGAID